MPQKIKGNIGSAGRILIFDESNFNTIEVNETVDSAGAFDIEVPTSGTKVVLARDTTGEAIGYGSVNSVYEAPGFQDYTADFTVPASNYACGYQTVNVISGYNSTSVLIGRGTGRDYNPWFRVSSVNIPQGATILSAKLKTEVRAVPGTGKAAEGWIADEDNAAPPYSSSQFWNKPQTSPRSEWNLYSSTVGNIYTWPEMSSHLQQVVDRPGWSTGNAVLLMFENAAAVNGTYRFGTGFGAQTEGWAWPTLTVSWRVYP